MTPATLYHRAFGDLVTALVCWPLGARIELLPRLHPDVERYL